MRVLIVVIIVLALQTVTTPPAKLPPFAGAKVRESLKAAAAHKNHIWRESPAFAGQLVHAYIEIPAGGREKYAFDMAKNAPVVDRVIPEKIGGYPANYGIVPQTVSFDGGPFDVLVLGPPIPTGQLVTGVPVGLMRMEDEKGHDSKVVLSRVGADGQPTHRLTDADRKRIDDFFTRYKRDDDDPATYAAVFPWGTAGDGLAFVHKTHEFFRQALK